MKRGKRGAYLRRRLNETSAHEARRPYRNHEYIKRDKGLLEALGDALDTRFMKREDLLESDARRLSIERYGYVKKHKH